MSERNWTPEPWELNDDGDITGDDADFPLVASEFMFHMRPNIERAVACVNACAKIGNPDAIMGLVEAFQEYKVLEWAEPHTSRTKLEAAWAKVGDALAALDLEE